MLRADYLLAISLLTAPPESNTAGTDAQRLAALRPILQTVAVRYEILDPREARYLLTRPEDYAADLQLLRRRYHDLADAPPASDALRLPTREVANELLAFNRAYRQHLGLRQPMELAHWWEYRAALQETDRLYQVWDAVRDARCEYYYVTVRRQALQKLRELIGREAYHLGELPPHVPLWRFQSLD